MLPKTAGSAQTHKSISFIWIVWSTLYVYLWHKYNCHPCQFWCFVQFDHLLKIKGFFVFFLQIAKVLAKAVTLVITMSASVESSDSPGNWKIVKQWDNFRILNATFEMSWSSAIFQTRIRYLFWSQFNFLNALHYYSPT